MGALSYKANADAAEVPLDRDEDVYRVAQQHGSAALLIFRPSGAAQEPLEGTLRLDDARTSDLGAQVSGGRWERASQHSLTRAL